MNSFLFLYADSPKDKDAPEVKFLSFNGAYIQYKEENGKCLVLRIISSNPKDYLDESISPGSDITELVNSSNSEW